MSHDDIFRDAPQTGANFEFDARVAEVFDDMLVRSIPFYQEQQRMICEIGARFWPPGSDVYDLGCSTATTLINLRRAIAGPAHFIGYDYSEPMLERAREKIAACGLAESIQTAQADLNGDLSRVPLANAGLVTLCWTLQFVRPLQRDGLLRWISQAMTEKGVLIVAEKVLTGHPQTNPAFIDFYHDYKRQNGYSDHEIMRKREALENVLVPYRVDENRELFQRNGFKIVETFFQWYNFAGFLCLKQPD
jgi:tRNA (cmo5U34)-methyltransferase